MRMSDKEQKKLGINEFRTWLEGVEAFQPEGWVPSLDQWKIIREKIDQLNDEPTPARVTGYVPPQYSQQSQTPEMQIPAESQLSRSTTSQNRPPRPTPSVVGPVVTSPPIDGTNGLAKDPNAGYESSFS